MWREEFGGSVEGGSECGGSESECGGSESEWRE